MFAMTVGATGYVFAFFQFESSVPLIDLSLGLMAVSAERFGQTVGMRKLINGRMAVGTVQVGMDGKSQGAVIGTADFHGSGVMTVKAIGVIHLTMNW